VSTHLTRIGEKARAHPDLGLTSRYHPMADIDQLQAGYRWLQSNTTVGVEEVTQAR
jgi:hypothetical protein